MTSMIHISEQALQAAREILAQHQIKYSELGKPEPKAGYNYHSDAPVNDIWVISYTHMVFEEEIALIYLDDRDGLKTTVCPNEAWICNLLKAYGLNK
jgi:hypothetical protein